MSTLFYFVELVIYVLLAMQVGYLLLFALASLFPYRYPKERNGSKPRWLVLYPAYREDKVIRGAAASAVNQDYPKDLFTTLVIADGCKPETVEHLRSIGAEVLEVQFEVSTKARALLKALELHAGSGFDGVVVLDADNHIRPNFLSQLSEAWRLDGSVLQAHRTAKNIQTPMAYLDHLNEEIGNRIFRKGHRVLGFSSALIGSGMAFPYAYLRAKLKGAEHLAGEDKELEFRILEEGNTIHYADHILVFDEKVSEGAQFQKQRKRWVGVQLFFLREYFVKGIKAFFSGKWDFADKVFQMALVPKLLLTGLLFGTAALEWLIEPAGTQKWMVLFCGITAALLLAIPRTSYNMQMVCAVLHIPVAFVRLALAIAGIRRGASSKFEVTEKGKDQV